MATLPDVDGFIRLVLGRMEHLDRATADRLSEQSIHDHVVFLLAYREAFEVLTNNDPELRKYVTDRIPMEWATDDRSDAGT